MKGLPARSTPISFGFRFSPKAATPSALSPSHMKLWLHQALDPKVALEARADGGVK